MPIPINVENGVAAMAMAQLAGCNEEELRYGMKTFQGAERRFDFKIKTDKLVLISDYAHHPKEILESAIRTSTVSLPKLSTCSTR